MTSKVLPGTPPMRMSLMQRAAGLLAESFLLKKGKLKWAENERDWQLPLSQLEKLLTGGYIILKDYSTGRFPPTFPDQQKAYENEIEIRNTLPGLNAAEVKDANMRKPFWPNKLMAMYLRSLVKLYEHLRQLEIAPPAKILELGCGSGWTSEYLAHLGYDVVGTTISPYEVEDGMLRVAGMRAKHLKPSLDYLVSPMENVFETTSDRAPFDAAFVFEALHHAHDWQKACQAVYQVLRPGGWFLLCKEPNVLHTFIAYRAARLANTHEIGFRKQEVVRALRAVGFDDVRMLEGRIGFGFRPFWLAARRPK